MISRATLVTFHIFFSRPSNEQQPQAGFTGPAAWPSAAADLSTAAAGPLAGPRPARTAQPEGPQVAQRGRQHRLAGLRRRGPSLQCRVRRQHPARGHEAAAAQEGQTPPSPPPAHPRPPKSRICNVTVAHFPYISTPSSGIPICIEHIIFL